MNSILRVAALSVVILSCSAAYGHDSLFEDRFSDVAAEAAVSAEARPTYSEQGFARVPAYRPVFIDPPVYPAQVFRNDDYADTLYAPTYAPYRLLSIEVR